MTARTRSAEPVTCTCPVVRHQHGTIGMYVNDSCGCDPCRAAHARGEATRRRLVAYGRHQPAMVDATGTRRRLQALMTLGWSVEAMGRELGITGRRLHALVNGSQQQVSRVGYDRAVELYDRLWDTPPVENDRGSRVSAERARRHAARRGYLRPMQLDDDDIDDPTAVHSAAVRRAA